MKILKWLKSLLSFDKCSPLQLSLTGKPLLLYKTSAFGWGVKGTEFHLQGATIAFYVEQCYNTDYILPLLRGEYDDYLTKEVKDRLISRVRHRLETSPISVKSFRSQKGEIEFNRVPWKQEETDTIRELIWREYENIY